VLAALISEGETTVDGAFHIDLGYPNFAEPALLEVMLLAPLAVMVEKRRSVATIADNVP